MAERRKSEVYRAAVSRFETPITDLSNTPMLPRLPPKLGPHGKLGIWVWIILLGADVAYELLGFADGPGGTPTISQLVKRLRRSGGIAGSIVLSLLLLVVYVLLQLHWIVEAF